MKISRHKIVYLLSLVVLGALLVAVFIRPAVTGNECSAIQKEQLIKTPEGWIVQFDLFNQEKSATSYDVEFQGDKNQIFREPVLIAAESSYTYIRHIKSAAVADGKVKIRIYKDGETTPFENATLVLNEH